MSTTPPLTHRTSTSPLSVRLAIISGTDNGCPDRKTLYTKVAQNRPTITDTIPIRSPHPSKIPIIEPSPLRIVCPINGPVLLECPDEFIPNTNVSRKRSTSTDTPPLCLSGTHDTPGLTFPPPRTPCPVITPEPAIHRQMNSRSELKSSYHVSSSISFICHVLYCSYDCFIFIVPPPLLLSDSLDDRCRCPCARLRRRRSYPPTVELPGKHCPFTSPRYRLPFCTFLLHQTYAAATL